MTRRLHGPLLSGTLAVLAVLCGDRADAQPRPPDGDFTFACGFLGDCPVRTVPGPADRDVRPFEGALGRPCTWRERPAPEGPRRIRTCS